MSFMKSMYIYISLHNMLFNIYLLISRPASLLSLGLILFIPSPLHWYLHSSNSYYMPSTVLSVCIILLLSVSSCSLLILSSFLMFEVMVSDL